MQETIDSHHLQKRYLDPFIATSDKRVFSTKRVSIKGRLGWAPFDTPIPTKKLCVQKNMYKDFSIPTPSANGMEDIFKVQFEDNWPSLIKSLINLPFNIYSKWWFFRDEILEDIKVETLINFLIYQYKRSLRTRENLVWKHVQNNPEITEEIKRIGVKKSEEILYMIAHNTFVSFLKQGQTVTWKSLMEIDWQLLINTSSLPFITSESPVVWFDEGLTLNDEGVIYAPLTPHIAIAIQLNYAKANRLIFFNEIDESMVARLNMVFVDRTYRGTQSYSRLISKEKDALEKALQSFDEKLGKK